MRVRLLGIYSHGPILFFMLRLNNRSPFDYAIDDIRFFIFQRGSANASEGDPWQPRSLLPVYVYDRMVTVAGHRLLIAGGKGDAVQELVPDSGELEDHSHDQDRRREP